MYQLLLHVVRYSGNFNVPQPPVSQIMAFLSFPYFWCIRVSPIQKLSIKLEYFLSLSIISYMFQLSRFDTVNSESGVRIHFNDRFDWHFCTLRHVETISL